MHNHELAGYICPLCQIIKGLLTERGPSEGTIVYQNALVTGFIAGKQWKAAKGHVIVVPNDHVENLYDLPLVLGNAVFEASKALAQALKIAYACGGVQTIQHNEPAGYQEVFHFHTHIIPRNIDDEFYYNFHETFWASIEDRRASAIRLKEALERVLV